MFSSAKQTQFSLTLDQLEQDLQVLSFTASEGISQLFRFEVELVSEQRSLNLETLLNNPAFLQLAPRFAKENAQ